MPYASVTVPEKQKLDSNQVDAAFAPMLNAFTRGVTQAVLTGDGAARAAEFTYNINTFREIFATGDYLFLNGHFKVGCDRPGSHWGFEGNMSNLMKKGADGQWRLYRQLAHN
jgi:ketosteroid isomerase-like protein